MTYDYLNNCYNQGIKITNFLGEDKALEILESTKITDTEFLDKFNNIIIEDDVLSDKITILREKNKELKTEQLFKGYPIICGILWIIEISLLLLKDFIGSIIDSVLWPFDTLLAVFGLIVCFLAMYMIGILFAFGC